MDDLTKIVLTEASKQGLKLLLRSIARKDEAIPPELVEARLTQTATTVACVKTLLSTDRSIPISNFYCSPRVGSAAGNEVINVETLRSLYAELSETFFLTLGHHAVCLFAWMPHLQRTIGGHRVPWEIGCNAALAFELWRKRCEYQIQQLWHALTTGDCVACATVNDARTMLTSSYHYCFHEVRLSWRDAPAWRLAPDYLFQEFFQHDPTGNCTHDFWLTLFRRLGSDGVQLKPTLEVLPTSLENVECDRGQGAYAMPGSKAKLVAEWERLRRLGVEEPFCYARR